MPTTVPKLLEKRSKQLLVVPGDTYRGDGPIIFTKILYKPEKNENSWSSIIGKNNYLNIYVENFTQKSSIWITTFFQFTVTKSLLRWWIWSRPHGTKSACSWVVLGKVERGLQGQKPSWRLTVLVRRWLGSQVKLKGADVICSWDTDNSIWNQEST